MKMIYTQGRIILWRGEGRREGKKQANKKREELMKGERQGEVNRRQEKKAKNMNLESLRVKETGNEARQRKEMWKHDKK